MRSKFHKISPISLRKIFLLICSSGFILLVFYLYYSKEDILLNYAKSRVLLHPNFFKNVSRIRKPDLCQSSFDNEKNAALIFVLSAPENRVRRQIIRSTWAQRSVVAELQFGVLFVVGEYDDEKTPLQNDLESEMFGDIIRTHRIDTYSHLVHKTIAGLQWVLDNCHVVKYVIKTDDDVFINPFALHKLLEELAPNSLVNVSSSVEPIIKEHAPFQPRLFTQSAKILTTNKIMHLNSSQKQFNINNIFQQSRNMNKLSESEINEYRNSIIRDLKFAVRRKQPPAATNQMSYNSPPMLPNSETDIYSDYDSNDIVETIKKLNGSQNEETVPISWNKTLFCLVWRNMPVVRDSNSKWSISDEHFKGKVYPTYCSGAAYIMPVTTAKLLVEAHDKKLPEDVLLVEDVYVTGVLAKEVGIGHVQIGTRYAFKSKHVESIAKGDIVFTHLGKDTDTLTNFIWYHVEDKKMKTGFKNKKNV